jgi:hypothetical protein
MRFVSMLAITLRALMAPPGPARALVRIDVDLGSQTGSGPV